MTFGKNLVEIRKRKGWTQEELASRSGIHVSQIRKYETERNSPTLDIITKLATSLVVSTDTLIFGKNDGVAQRRLDPDLLDRFEKIKKLPPEDYDTVRKMIDAILFKSNVGQMIK